MENTAKNIIKSTAIQLGFSSIGFAETLTLDKEIEFYKISLEKGYFASMKYLERNIDERHDISLLLPGAKTIIVTATNYFTTYSHSENHTGKISRYGWGDDYHEVIKPRLEQLAEKIVEIYPDSLTKCYVDTGHILEKQWASRGGIGWQGKNSLILSKELGSWFFIGIIITTAEFEPDSIIDDHCGKCSLCINACPTGAIVQPKVVDSRKCIAYWTIESKSEEKIPSDVAEKLNGWLFGCDICQDVCPWNRKVKPTTDLHFFPRNNETSIKTKEIIDMTRDEFLNRFKNSPLKRAKLEKLKETAVSDARC